MYDQIETFSFGIILWNFTIDTITKHKQDVVR